MVRHLQAEQHRLSGEVAQLEQTNSVLTLQNDQLRERTIQLDHDREALEGNDRQRSAVAESAKETLQMDLDESKREVDLKTVECEHLRFEIRTANQRLDTTREIQAKLEMESQQMADELDVARDRASKLIKAEAAIDKYQKRLEDLAAVKKENKELLDKLDEYLDKIHELESSNKGMATLTKMVEQYKDKAVEMEREKFEAVSAMQMQQHEVQRQATELEQALDARRFLEEELFGVRSELERRILQDEEEVEKKQKLQGVAQGEGAIGGSEHQFSLETESMASLKEKVKRLERELRVSVQAARGDGSSGSGSNIGTGNNSSSSSSSSNGNTGDGGGFEQELAFVRAELADVLAAKKDREDMLLQTKKKLAETQLELQRSARAITTMGQQQQQSQSGNLATVAAVGGGGGGVATVTAAAHKEIEQKLAQTANTVRLLEDKLKEKEGTINKLEQEKGKLEVFSKSTLTAFKVFSLSPIALL